MAIQITGQNKPLGLNGAGNLSVVPTIVSKMRKVSMAKFTFIDLFAGIGGFRLGLEGAGGKVVFSNEWDQHAATTYKAWFGDNEISTEDIRELDPKRDIPIHDVLSAG